MARIGHAIAVAGGRLYVLGGDSGPSTNLSDIQVSGIRAPAAKGHYSRLFDVGNLATSIDGVIWGGDSTSRGLVRVEYRVADVAGTFGVPVDRGFVPVGTAALVGSSGVRYLLLRLTLDDTDHVTVGSAEASQRDIQSITLVAGGRCAGVVCTAGAPCRVAGPCDPATGNCTSPAAPDGTGCSDENACTHLDACQAGSCVGGAPVVCPALDECHRIGSCVAATGACLASPAPDGTPCNGGTCQGAACVPATPAGGDSGGGGGSVGCGTGGSASVLSALVAGLPLLRKRRR